MGVCLLLAIRRPLKRLQKRLTRAVDSNGFPHPVLRAFAAHLQEHLIEPSYRFKHAAARRQKALATIAGLVGALTLARAVDDPKLSDEILEAAAATFGRS